MQDEIAVYAYAICRIVIETLRGVDEGRRCFRMVGEVLVERTVKDVLPALQYNSQQVSTFSCLFIQHTK